MKVIRSIESVYFDSGCSMSIGNFDGIHLGHQAIVNRVIEKAKALDVPSVIVTFEPHPHEYFVKESADRIMGLREKYLALNKLSPDYLIIMKFNKSLSNTTAESFIEDILIKRFNIKCLIVGDDFRFGKKRMGDYSLLKSYAKKYRFKLENTNTLQIDNQRVSSTRIRQLLNNYDFQSAQVLLGRPFFIAGRVLHGDKRGRELGFPTLNIRVKKQRTIVSGVFVVHIHGLGKVRQGVANMGYRPTLPGEKKLLLEVHIFDFNQKCYGRHVSIVFIQKLRDEKRFESLEKLRNQIDDDAKQARSVLLRSSDSVMEFDI